MARLNEKQYQYIKSKLTIVPLKHEPLKEEFIDHLCSDIEFKMDTGLSFSQATQTTFDTFDEDEMQEIDKQTILLLNQNNVIMKKVFILTVGLLFLGILMWTIQAEIPKTPPLNNEPPPVAEVVDLKFQKEPPAISPLKGDFKVASSFGMRMHPLTKVMKKHKGVDFIAPLGTPVYATSDGIVEKAKVQDSGVGTHIIIRHDDNYQTAYNHLSKIEVKAGQKVTKGDLIGAVGSTGASTGPHLHYEVIKSGEWVDPEPYLKP